MLHEAASCIFVMSNAAFSDASFSKLGYAQGSRAGQWDCNHTHRETANKNESACQCGSLGVSACGYLPRVKCQFGVSGPFCHGSLSFLGVNGSLDVFRFTSMMNLPRPISNGHQRCL